MIRYAWLPALLLAAVATTSFAGTYTEDFTTSTYRDPVNTTADWNTGTGEIGLFPFSPGVLGSYATASDALALVVDGDFAYVANWVDGLLILDISDPANPSFVGSYDSPGLAYGVTIAGDIAYIADSQSGLQIVDISNPASPTLLGSYDTDGSAQDVAVAGDLALVTDNYFGLVILDVSNPASPTLVAIYYSPGVVREVEIAGDLAFIAQNDDNGLGGPDEGLLILDISDPSTPSPVGFYNTLGKAYGLAVDGDLAFIADYWDGLEILDISDPSNPTSVANYYVPGYAPSRVAVLGDRLYTADDSGLGLNVLDISSPATPTLVQSYDPSPLRIRNVAVDGNLAFVLRHDVNSITTDVVVVQIADPISAPPLSGNYNTPVPTSGLALSGNLVFVADDVEGVQVVDVSDPSSPSSVGIYNTPGSAKGIAVDGDLAFVADFGSGLQVLDISDPANPSSLGSYDTPGLARSVAVTGGLALVADGTSGLQIINISDPTSPSLAGTYDTPGTAYGVTVAGDLAFVADDTFGLQIISIVNPASPTLVGTYNTSGSSRGVDVAGNLAFVADYLAGMQIINITNPASPTLVTTYNTPSYASGVTVAGNLAYIADGFSGLRVVNITNPASPQVVHALDTPDFAYQVAVAGRMAYVADYNSGIQIFQLFQDEVDGVNNRGQSTVVDGDTETIVRARVTTVQTAGATLELSADGGTTFQSVTPGPAWTAFTVPGTDLLWRSTHSWSTPGVNPTLSNLDIAWLNDFAPISSIADVPNDQGGEVDITFPRSGFDFPDETTFPVVGYAIYRRVDDPQLVQQVLRGKEANFEDLRNHRGLESFAPEHLRVLGETAFVVGSHQATVGTLPPGVWQGVGWLLPTQSDIYTARVDTRVDSSATGSGYSVFVTAVHTSTPSIWYASAPESAYSVDNIPPGAPQTFTATWVAGSINLNWAQAPEPDFQTYRVYRSTDPGFIPGPGTLVHETVSNSWQDTPANPGGVYYKVTTLDLAGNESPPTGSGSVTAIGDGAVPGVFALGAAVPNPLRSANGTRIAFDLPLDSVVTLEIFDVTGRLVRTLAGESKPAGSHTEHWDGTDTHGRAVSAGVYLYRLRAQGYEATQRMVVIR